MKQTQFCEQGSPGQPFGAPWHLAVIMDGNGRWALQRTLARSQGHQVGTERVRDLCRWSIKAGIRYLSVYAFSTENWQRPAKEVSALLKLLRFFFKRYCDELIAEGIRVRFMGDLRSVPEQVAATIAEAEARTANGTVLDLIICFNYGGRHEIIEAVRAMMQSGLQAEDLSEAKLAAYLYLPDVPDPDLILRPGGEQRLSNFLLWRSAYAELIFQDVLWPDFSERDFDEAIAIYKSRHRRFGRTEEQA